MTERWIDLGGRQIHCLYREGSGPDLVFIPGGALDSTRLTWKKVIEAVPEGYRILAFDLPGFGGSDSPPDGADTREYSGTLRLLFRRLDVFDPVLFGASMGAAIALDLVPIGRDAAPTADRVCALVLAGAYGLQGRVPMHEAAYLLSRFDGLHRLARPLLRSRAVMRGVLKAVVHEPTAVDDELIDDALSEARRDEALDAFFDWLRYDLQQSCVRSNFRQDLRRMHLPVLLLHGEHDWMMPAASAREAANRFPDAELHVLNAGHMVPRERPDDVNRIVHDFLRRVAPL